MTRILVVEDNPDLAYGLRNNLEIEGYAVDVVVDGTQGLARARTGGPDLIILDLMLPGMDGYRVLRALRDEGRRMPVLILTARGEEADKVRGLRLGADDYVTKPFGVLELLARVEALLRRAAPPGRAGGAVRRRRDRPRVATAPRRLTSAYSRSNSLGVRHTGSLPRRTVRDAGTISTSPNRSGGPAPSRPGGAARRSSASTRASSSSTPNGLVT